MRKVALLAGLIGIQCSGAIMAAETGDAVLQRAEQVVRESFSNATPEERKARLDQDQAQALCSRFRNAPPPDQAASLMAEALKSIRFPEDGKLMGDWKEGEKLAAIGTGG